MTEIIENGVYNEIPCQVATMEDGTVVIIFGKPIKQFLMDPETAYKFALCVMRSAGCKVEEAEDDQSRLDVRKPEMRS